LGKRFSESFGLAIGKLKQLSQNEQTLDGRVAVDKRALLGFEWVMVLG
jgi:hypothetical protein